MVVWGLALGCTARRQEEVGEGICLRSCGLVLLDDYLVAVDSLLMDFALVQTDQVLLVRHGYLDQTWLHISSILYLLPKFSTIYVRSCWLL